MNGDEVRNVRFRRGFYDASQVNDLLDRIAAGLDAGRPAGPLIANATFRIRTIRLGYDVGAVAGSWSSSAAGRIGPSWPE